MNFYNTTNRIDEAILNANKKITKLRATGKDLQGTPIEQSLKNLDKEMAISPMEHASFQNHQSRAYAMQRINQDESMTIYTALGESMNPDNGGWAEHVGLPEKIGITLMLQQLIGGR